MANFTKLLLHCDGIDGSTSFPDASIYTKTVTAVGNAQVDTAQSKFGGASALFDGTGDWLSVGSSSDFDFLAGIFTIDFWVNFSSVPTGSEVGLASNGVAGGGNGWRLMYDPTGTDVLNFGVNASTLITANWTPSPNTWYHIAVVRDASTSWILFIDGVSSGTSSLNTGINNSANPLLIGKGFTNSGGVWVDINPLTGWIDEFRVSKGIARWTTNFTPPSSAYSDPSSTSSSSSSCRSSSSSSSSRSSSSSSRSSSSSCSSSSSKSMMSSSSSSCRSSSSSCRSSSSSSSSHSSSSSSLSTTMYRPEGLNKVSSTITFEQDKQSEYVADVDTDLSTLFQTVNRGYKPMRLTTSQRNALTNIYAGLIIVNLTTNKLNWYTGSGWEQITSA